MILPVQLILESKVDDLAEKYSGQIKHQPDIIYFATNDPSPTKKYLEWMIQSYIYANQTSDAKSLIVQLVNFFHKISPRIEQVVKSLGLNFNDKLRSIDGWELSRLNSLYVERQNFLSKSEKKKFGTDVIYRGQKWVVVKPKTFESSCIYGSNTKWCTTQNQHNFNSYSKHGLYYFIDVEQNKLNPYNPTTNAGNPMFKFAIAVGAHECDIYDSTDRDIGSTIGVFNGILDPDLENALKSFARDLINNTSYEQLSKFFRNKGLTYITFDKTILTNIPIVWLMTLVGEENRMRLYELLVQNDVKITSVCKSSIAIQQLFNWDSTSTMAIDVTLRELGYKGVVDLFTYDDIKGYLYAKDNDLSNEDTSRKAINLIIDNSNQSFTDMLGLVTLKDLVQYYGGARQFLDVAIHHDVNIVDFFSIETLIEFFDDDITDMQNYFASKDINIIDELGEIGKYKLYNNLDTKADGEQKMFYRQKLFEILPNKDLRLNSDGTFDLVLEGLSNLIGLFDTGRDTDYNYVASKIFSEDGDFWEPYGYGDSDFSDIWDDVDDKSFNEIIKHIVANYIDLEVYFGGITRIERNVDLHQLIKDLAKEDDEDNFFKLTKKNLRKILKFKYKKKQSNYRGYDAKEFIGDLIKDNEDIFDDLRSTLKNHHADAYNSAGQSMYFTQYLNAAKGVFGTSKHKWESDKLVFKNIDFWDNMGVYCNDRSATDDFDSSTMIGFTELFLDEYTHKLRPYVGDYPHSDEVEKIFNERIMEEL